MREPIRLNGLHIKPRDLQRMQQARPAAPVAAEPGDVTAYRAALVKALYRKIHAAERELAGETQPAVGLSLAGRLTGLRDALALVKEAQS